MPITATVLPKIPQKGLLGFLLWLKRDHPAMYYKLASDVPAVSDFERTMDLVTGYTAVKGGASPVSGFGDISDAFSSIGDALASAGSAVAGAAGSIATWVGSNAGPILQTGLTVAKAVEQQRVVDSQLQLAMMGRAPNQVAKANASTAGGMSTYYPVGQGGILSGSLLGLPTWVWLAGGGGLVLLLLLRRR